MDRLMTLQPQFEIRSALNPADLASLSVRVKLYDRALKPTLLQFVASENLRIQKTILTDSYVDYEIACKLEHSVGRLEQVLRKASHV